MRQPLSDDPIPPEILQEPKFYPYFKDCVGAIDGTHIHAHIPISEQAAWRNRKGFISQNVFAACSFDLQFTFVHAGWEGSAHDSLIWKDAYYKGRFKPPAGRYYLADAGFSSNEFMMIPYQKVRYHLKEWEKANLRPQTKEELFNLRHSQLRNAVERIFGVLKRKFKILAKAPEYSFNYQVDLVLALTALHNFIAIRDRLTDPDFKAPQTFDEPIEPPPIIQHSQAIPSQKMDRMRNDIAENMWLDYQCILRERELFL